MASRREDDGPHFVLIPLLAQGHLIPMADLARLLAQRGALVSLVATPLNLARMGAAVDAARASALPIRFVSIPFPCEEAGLPAGCENIDVLPSADLARNFYRALTLTCEPIKRHLRGHPPLPSCVVSDMCLPWSRHVAAEFGVPRFIFSAISCFALLCDHNLTRYDAYGGVADDMQPFLVPGLPHRVEITTAQLPATFHGDEWRAEREEAQDAELTSAGVIVNSFEGLEPLYARGLRGAKGMKAYTVGPMFLCNGNPAEQSSRGEPATVDTARCVSWLDARGSRSVLYVCFGSLARTPLSRVAEIGAGLEAAGHPFVWVIRSQEAAVEEWLAEGFEERTKERALIIRGWAPQVTILSHPAVGGFLTHGGWNSCLEALSSGVPMITWPGFSEQFLNERFLVDVLGVAAPVGVKVLDWWGINGGGGVVVKREQVETAVRKLMDDGEEMRRRAGELGKMARAAVEVGGSSYENLTSLIDHVRLTRDKQKKAPQPSSS